VKTCLAFDQSSTFTGIALGVETQPTVYHVEWAVTIKTPTPAALLVNFPWQRMPVFEPDIVAHEEGFVGKNPKTGKGIRHAGIVIATTGGWVEMFAALYLPYARLYSAMATTWRPPVWGSDYQEIINEKDKKERERALKAYSVLFATAHLKEPLTFPDDHQGDAIGIMAWAFIEDRKQTTYEKEHGGKI